MKTIDVALLVNSFTFLDGEHMLLTDDRSAIFVHIHYTKGIVYVQNVKANFAAYM
jgi:hypothetical protein